jgi:imidazolonepropionase-like amidohydrolase
VTHRFQLSELGSGLFLLFFFISLLPSLAQSDPTGERRVTQTIAIKNATVTTSPGKTLQGATVIISNGLIESIGVNIKIPANAQVITGDSLFIYPAFIDAASTAGVTKPAEPEKPAGFDYSKPADEIAGITPWRSVLEYHDMKKNDVAEFRKAGFALAQLVPEGGMLPGKAAIVVYGGKESTNVLAQQTALYARFRGSRGMYPGTTLGVMAKFRDLYKNAAQSSKHDRLFASNAGINRPEYNKTFHALYPVIDKNIPVMFEVGDELEIRRALRLQKELDFKLVLVGVTEASSLLDEIKVSNAQVILSLKLPEDKAAKGKANEQNKEADARQERIKTAYMLLLQQASLLEKAGIPFAFTTIGLNPADAMKNMRLMIENGLSENTALAALTSQPASMLGIQKFAGSLEKGKLANIVVMTAPIFDKQSQVKMVVADGYLFTYETKQNQPAKSGEERPTEMALEGTWDYTSETPAGSSEGTLAFEKSGDSFKGVITYDDPAGSGKVSSQLNNITISGSSLSFSFEVAAGGMNLTVNVNGEINEDEFKGNMNLGQYGSYPLNATKNPTQHLH